MDGAVVIHRAALSEAYWLRRLAGDDELSPGFAANGNKVAQLLPAAQSDFRKRLRGLLGFCGSCHVGAFLGIVEHGLSVKRRKRLALFLRNVLPNKVGEKGFSVFSVLLR